MDCVVSIYCAKNDRVLLPQNLKLEKLFICRRLDVKLLTLSNISKTRGEVDGANEPFPLNWASVNMLDIITLQLQTGGFVIQVGESRYGDEPVNGIEAVAVQPHEKEENTIPERNFFIALEHVLETLEEIEMEDLPKNREIIQLLSGGLPMCSVETVGLLLGHIYQTTVMTEEVSNEDDFAISLEVVLEGFAEMKKDESLVPSELTSLFEKEPPPSLLRAIRTLLDPTESEEKYDAPYIHTLQLQEAQKHEAFSDCATTVALTDAPSSIADFGWHSSQTPEATTSPSQNCHTPTMFDLHDIVASGGTLDLETNLNIQVAQDIYETASADSRVLQVATDSIKCETESRNLDPLAFRYVAEREGLLIPLLSNKKMKSSSDDEMKVVNREATTMHQVRQDNVLQNRDVIHDHPLMIPSLGKDMCMTFPKEESIVTNTHYDEALNNIKMIRMVLNLQETKGEEKTAVDDTLQFSVESDDAITISLEKMTGQPTVEKSSMADEKTQSNIVMKDDSNVDGSQCDSTVECSLDSVNITDDETSKTSDKSIGSGWWNCAMDVVLDTVLGSCWEEDSLLGSGGSCCVSCNHSHCSGGDCSSSLSVAESVDSKPDLTIENKQITLVIDRDHELRAQRAKSPIMESDSECIESEESDWWVYDIAGSRVETKSFTSF